MNQFGKMLRRERKERHWTLGDLAKKLGLSVPYLSQIETGVKPVQDNLVERAIRVLGLIGDDVNELRRAAALSASEYTIRVSDGADVEERALAASLASGFARLSPERREELRKIMEDSSRG